MTLSTMDGPLRARCAPGALALSIEFQPVPFAKNLQSIAGRICEVVHKVLPNEAPHNPDQMARFDTLDGARAPLLCATQLCAAQLQ
jgi:hypothetical protein